MIEQPKFTPEQVDYICYVIGEWYLDWRSAIGGDKHAPHRLGYAKEKLKEMLFPVRELSEEKPVL